MRDARETHPYSLAGAATIAPAPGGGSQRQKMGKSLRAANDSGHDARPGIME
jgi:hypothetical protein